MATAHADKAAPESVPDAMPPTADEQGAESGKKKRNLMTEILGISISNARCLSHMKATLTPPEAEILPKLREELKNLKAAAKMEGAEEDDPPEKVVAKQKEIEALNSEIVRIGGDAPIAMAAMCDYIVKSAIAYSMGQTVQAGHKMVELSALHAGEPSKNLDVWPLIASLPSIAEYDPTVEAALKTQRAAENRAMKEAREATKKARDDDSAGPEAAASAGPEAAASAADCDAEDGDGEPGGSTTTFHTYVDQATKAVKKDEAFASMRVANRLREVLSKAVAEFVDRISRVAKVSTLELMCVRTLNAKHLLPIFKAIYVSQLVVKEYPRMLPALDYVNCKVKAYEQYEKDRKKEEDSDDAAAAAATPPAPAAKPPAAASVKPPAAAAVKPPAAAAVKPAAKPAVKPAAAQQQKK